MFDRPAARASEQLAKEPLERKICGRAEVPEDRPLLWQ